MFLPCPSGSVRPGEGGGWGKTNNGLKNVFGIFSMFSVFLEISTFVRPPGQWIGYVLCREF